MSLVELRQWLKGKRRDGVQCPACDQLAKEYLRKLNSSNTFGLIEMFRIHGQDWGHVPTTTTLARLGGEFARLALWGLVEELSEPRPDGGRAGWWRVTDRGVQFIRGEISLPAYARVYNGRLVELQGDEISITEALGTKFNYQELMAGV